MLACLPAGRHGPASFFFATANPPECGKEGFPTSLPTVQAGGNDNYVYLFLPSTIAGYILYTIRVGKIKRHGFSQYRRRNCLINIF